MAFYLSCSTYTTLTTGIITADPTEFSTVVWAKPYQNTGWITTRTDNSGVGTSWSHMIRYSGSWSGYMFDGAQKALNGSTQVRVNEWTHVAITAKNNDFLRLYVNGAKDPLSVSIGTMWTGGDRWQICGPRTLAISGVPQPYPPIWGEVGYVCHWNKQLTDSEIYRTYANTTRLIPLSIYPDSIHFYFSMNDVPVGQTVSGGWDFLRPARKLSFTQTQTGTPTVMPDFLTV